nr:E3 ubiquitin/ISG15 ligase TRIM25-like [Cavia porcellus]
MALPDMQKVPGPDQDQDPASKPPHSQFRMSMNRNLCKCEDQFLCPICLEVFRDPITTTCGHNFCMTCLQNFWDHQAAVGEMYHCPQCRESFPSRPELRKNVILENLVTCITQAKGQVSRPSRNLAGPKDVPCDFCFPQKLRSVKSCLQCVASLCEKHLRSHYDDQVFQDHQLLEPVWDLKTRLCRKHHKLRRLYCHTEGRSVCRACLLEEHKNHRTTPLEEERARMEVEVRKVQANVENQMLIIASDSQKHQGRVAFLSKLTQTTRDEVNTCFSDIVHEIKQLQMKVLDFVEKEKMDALGKLGSSIQQSHNRLLKLEGNSVWLHTLLTNRSDEQFLQEFPMLRTLPACKEPLMGIDCEETQSFLQLSEILAELRARLVDVGLNFVNQLFTKGIRMNSYEVLPPAVDRKTLLQCYCNLNFDSSTASEELILFKETHSVLNLGILLEPQATVGPMLGFKQWPQVLCSRALSEGRHYWEAEVSNSWVCLGVTYHRSSPRLGGRPRRHVSYLLGRNAHSWCLEWDSLRLSAWHDNSQTVLRGAYHRVLGVALDLGAGCLSFYSVAGGVSLLYRFLATFLEPLYPAVMVGSGPGSLSGGPELRWKKKRRIGGVAAAGGEGALGAERSK